MVPVALCPRGLAIVYVKVFALGTDTTVTTPLNADGVAPAIVIRCPTTKPCAVDVAVAVVVGLVAVPPVPVPLPLRPVIVKVMDVTAVTV